MIHIKEQFDYNKDGKQYSGYRRADSRIAQHIWDALGNAKTILNVGAGTGSYEPEDRQVLAIEPSEVMRSQRPSHFPPAIRGTADSLPFDDKSFDASMAILTVHHWPDRAKGLSEMRRVTKGPVVIMTFDSDADTEFWMFDYVPEMAGVERLRYKSIQTVTEPLGGICEVRKIAVPRDCIDRFQVALYARPEEFLNSEVRKSQSAWKFLSPGVEDRFVSELSADLKSGAWDEKYGKLRSKPFINCQLRLVVATT